MKTRSFAPSMAVLGLVAAGMLAVAGTAAADSSQCTTYKSGSYASCAGHAWFQASGEHFFIEDRVADGHSVAVHYTINGVTKTAYNRSGRGKVVDVNLSLPEGTIVEYKVCLSKDSKDLAGSCSGGVRDAA
jgi:hypothetical protein